MLENEKIMKTMQVKKRNKHNTKILNEYERKIEKLND